MKMKGKLTILLLFIWMGLFGQKVPDTNTFSLQDVVNVVNPTTNDLQDCINDAIESYYDPTYYTPPATSLLEFRNYGPDTAINYVSTSGYHISSASYNYIVIDYPNNLQNDDVLILLLSQKESIDFTTPSGWTLLDKVNDATMSYAVYWRRVDGSEPVTQQITMATSVKGAIIWNYRGVSSTETPYGATASSPALVISGGGAVSGNTGDLGIQLWIINEELIATNNGASGWIEDYNNGSSGTSGFTFVIASYLFGTSPSTVLTYPNYNSYSAYCRFVLPN